MQCQNPDICGANPLASWSGKLSWLWPFTCTRVFIRRLLGGNWPQFGRFLGITHALAQFVTHPDADADADAIAISICGMAEEYLRGFHAKFMTVHQRRHRCKHIRRHRHLAAHPSLAVIEQCRSISVSLYLRACIRAAQLCVGLFFSFSFSWAILLIAAYIPVYPRIRARSANVSL